MSAVFSSMTDLVLVSRPITGQPADRSALSRVCGASDMPVFANTGVNIDNEADVMAIADDCIIGTHFNQDSDTWKPVDSQHVKRFMDKAATLQ